MIIIILLLFFIYISFTTGNRIKKKKGGRTRLRDSMQSYETIDADISEITAELKCHPDQIGYARRGMLYGQRALLAIHNENTYLTESSLRSAVKDYSVALEEGFI